MDDQHWNDNSVGVSQNLKNGIRFNGGGHLRRGYLGHMREKHDLIGLVG